MPEISRFLGIVIRMYYDDHVPPHGRLPPRSLALIVEWASLHEAELLANWDRLRRKEPPVRVLLLE